MELKPTEASDCLSPEADSSASSSLLRKVRRGENSFAKPGAVLVQELSMLFTSEQSFQRYGIILNKIVFF